MSVLTHKEYMDISEVSPPVVKEKKKKTEEKPDIKPVIEYHLVHPENEFDYYKNFEDVIVIDGKEHQIKCKNGLVRTSDEILKDYLISKEYILINKKEINNG